MQRIPLRTLLEARNGTIIPGCHDAFGARLVAQAGFKAASISGFAVSGAMGLPDGYLSMDDMVQRAGEVARSIRLPVLVDGDNGYGGRGCMADTVVRLEQVGAGGMHVDDQQLPSTVGAPKRLIPIDDMQSKIAAACATRMSQDFTIIGCTGAMATHGFDEALRRARALEEAGADAVMIMYLTSRAEVVEAVGALRAPLILVVTETARRSFRAKELTGIGHAATIYPVSCLLTSLAAQHAVLTHLAQGCDTEAFIDRMMPMDQVRSLGGLV